jgi:hypothetical protein
MQERIHPHMDYKTKELVETAKDLKFVVTPKNDCTEILANSCSLDRLLEHITKIWKKSVFSIEHHSELLVTIKIKPSVERQV